MTVFMGSKVNTNAKTIRVDYADGLVDVYTDSGYQN